MSFKLWSVGLLLVIGFTVRADEKLAVLVAGSEVYSNVVVTGVTATDVYFTHAQGMGNVKLSQLSPELQKHFNYDPAKAATAVKQQSAANVEYHKEVASQPVVKPPDETRLPVRSVPMPPDLIAPQLYARSFLHQRAPDFYVEKWITPRPDTKGKFILIDFWATWCGPCRRSIPELNQIQARFKDHLVVVGISDETEADVLKMTSPKIDYSVAIDTQARTEKIAGVTGIPHSMLVDPNGIVRFEGMPGYLQEAWLAQVLDSYYSQQ